ncbi:metalloprotease stcE, partial [Escherichia coli 90.0039]
MICRVRWPQR